MFNLKPHGGCWKGERKDTTAINNATRGSSGQGKVNGARAGFPPFLSLHPFLAWTFMRGAENRYSGGVLEHAFSLLFFVLDIIRP